MWISRVEPVNLYISNLPKVTVKFSQVWDTVQNALQVFEVPMGLALGHCIRESAFYSPEDSKKTSSAYMQSALNDYLLPWQRALCSFSVHSHSLGLFS